VLYVAVITLAGLYLSDLIVLVFLLVFLVLSVVSVPDLTFIDIGFTNLLESFLLGSCYYMAHCRREIDLSNSNQRQITRKQETSTQLQTRKCHIGPLDLDHIEHGTDPIHI
jgi:hypothetical protein